MEWFAEKIKARIATRFNNHDGLLHLSIVLKISLLSEASLEPSETTMMELFCENNNLLIIFAKSLIVDVRLDSKYTSAFTWGLSNSLKYFKSVNHQICC